MRSTVWWIYLSRGHRVLPALASNQRRDTVVDQPRPEHLDQARFIGETFEAVRGQSCLGGLVVQVRWFARMTTACAGSWWCRIVRAQDRWYKSPVGSW